MNPLRILLIEDVEADYLLIGRHLRKNDFPAELHWIQGEPELTAALAAGDWDLVLSDYKVPGLDFAESLARIRRRCPDVPVILISGSIGEEAAVELLKQGLTDFVLKDRLVRLIPAIERGLNEEAERRRRREAEAGLVQSEQLMRAVLEGTSDAVFVKDRDGRYLLFNTGASRLTGVATTDAIGSDDTRLFPPEVARHIMTQDAAIMAAGRVQSHEETLRHLNGETRVYHVTKGPIFNRHGQVDGLFGVSRDITEQQQAKEQLRRLSQEYRTLLDNVPDGIVLLSPALHIVWVNRAARDMFTLQAETDYIGTSCHTVFWNRTEGCPSCPVVRCLDSRANEMGWLSPGPTNRELEIRAVPLIDDHGELTGIIEIVRDITAHRSLEEQFRQAQKMESIGTLAGGIAHDFNNILSAVLGYAEIALEDLDSGHPAHRHVRTIMEAGLRASHLTRDLLMFSRKQVSRKEPVDVNTLVTRIEKFIRRIIGEDIQFETRLAKQDLKVLADSHQIDQVLMNFATNARDAMSGGGVLTVMTQRIEIDQEFINRHGFGAPGPHVRITVADTGRGMDRATMAKIFDPFFTTKEMGKGTGLGMAVVYGIVTDHQGCIHVESEPGEGTVFEVYLPLIDDAGQDVREPMRRASVRGGRETILLAEDDATVRDLFVRVLEHAGYTVVTAINGEEAVHKFRTCPQPVDLLLFDLVMPKMNGKLAMEAIQRLVPDVRGLFISGYAPENIRQKELLVLDREVLFKPASPKDLLQAVRTVLDRPADTGNQGPVFPDGRQHHPEF